MGYDTVLYEVTDDHVATVTLNRPEVLNSFNLRMINELVDVWQTIRRDDHVHAVVLCGAGEKGFCAGLDMRDTATTFTDRGESDGPTPTGVIQGTMANWDFQDVAVFIGPKHNQVWKPVVTAVHGSCCAGGMYFVNESDIVIASDDATFSIPM